MKKCGLEYEMRVPRKSGKYTVILTIISTGMHLRTACKCWKCLACLKLASREQWDASKGIGKDRNRQL